MLHAAPMEFAFALFTLLCVLAGLVLAVGAVGWVMEYMLLRAYRLAALVEAARELQARGRSPWLNRWMRRQREKMRRAEHDE